MRVQHLRLSEKSCRIRSILDCAPFDFLCPVFFRRRLQSCRKIWSQCQFSRKLLIFYFARSSRWSPLLFPGCWHPPAILEMLLWDYFPMFYLHARLSKVIGRTASRLHRCPGIILLALYFCRFVMDKRSNIYSPFLSYGIYFVTAFPRSMWRRELNRGNRKMMLVLFFGFL